MSELKLQKRLVQLLDEKIKAEKTIVGKFEVLRRFTCSLFRYLSKENLESLIKSFEGEKHG